MMTRTFKISLLAVLLCLQALDYVSTSLAVHGGAVEMNPLASNLLLAKLLAALICFVLMCHAKRPAMPLLLTAFYVGVVMNNMGQI